MPEGEEHGVFDASTGAQIQRVVSEPPESPERPVEFVFNLQTDMDSSAAGGASTAASSPDEPCFYLATEDGSTGGGTSIAASPPHGPGAPTAEVLIGDRVLSLCYALHLCESGVADASSFVVPM